MSQTMDINALKMMIKDLSYEDKLEIIKFIATELSEEKDKYYLFKNSDIVVLETSNYEKLLEEIEDLDDICAYDKAIAENSEAIPFERQSARIQPNLDEI